jgi:surfactin synthase thioesterase subunit
MSESLVINTPHYAWTYERLGTGPNIVVAFPGANSDHRLFQSLADRLKLQFSFYCFALPGSLPHERNVLPIPPSDLNLAVKMLVERDRPSSIALLGFSIGCRLCLTILESKELEVNICMLVAPEPFRPNRFYQFCTTSALGKSLFYMFLRQPKTLKPIFMVAKAARLLPERKLRLVETHVADEDRARKIYNTWNANSRFLPNFESLKRRRASVLSSIHIIVGNTDPILNARDLKFIASHYPDIHIKTFAAGHVFRHPFVLDYLQNSLLTRYDD